MINAAPIIVRQSTIGRPALVVDLDMCGSTSRNCSSVSNASSPREFDSMLDGRSQRELRHSTRSLMSNFY